MFRLPVLAVLLCGLMSACATPPPASDPAAAPSAPTAEAAPAPTASAPVAPMAVAVNGDQVVCKYYDVTGSNVRKQRVCKSRSDWERDMRDARAAGSSMQNRGSMQPGGESLQQGR